MEIQPDTELHAVDLEGPSSDVRTPPLRRLRRFFYRNLGPPRMPMAFSLGCYLVKRFPGRIPFTRFASPNHYTFYIPPFDSDAYRRTLVGGIRRDLHMSAGPTAVTLAVTSRCPCSCYHCSAHRRPPEERWTPASWRMSSRSAQN